jgi:putative ABC transport system substrate-binding protein
VTAKIRRRAFITILGGAAAWPLATRAQQTAMPVIGVLVPANPEPFSAEFRAGLRERGYVEGQNIAFELRSADGKPDRLRELADELVHLNVAVIVSQFTPAITAARHGTSEIPIVMAWAGDPVGTGLISSLARPGGNITGLGAPEGFSAKVLELVRSMLPTMGRVAALTNSADPYSRPFIEGIESAGQALGIAVQSFEGRNTDELEKAFAAMAKARADAVLMQTSLPRKPAIDLALRYGLPLISGNRLLPVEGGLMSYSIQQNDMYRRAAYYVDRILKGAKPADLPVELPTRYELVVNLKTAKALGIAVPPMLLATADEVIE